MGCDIHMYVEYKKNNSDKWESGDFYRENPYRDYEDENDDKYSVVELHGDRNYGLFSTLAGVRDYTGMVVPVSEPKGFPEDACDFVNKEFEEQEGDAHTPSFLTLKEIREHQAKNPKMFHSGMISPEQAEALDNHNKFPESWCQWTNNYTYVKRKWSEPNNFLNPLIEKMETRALYLLHHGYGSYNVEDDENIRIVFWFDN